MTFAGFWVDGAVRQPEAKHCDSDNAVLAKWKRTATVLGEFDICNRSFSKWDCVYWLDTTPRESLTPAELFSVVKVLAPAASRVEKRNDGPSMFWIVDEEDSDVNIDWGNLTQYPPPIEPRWVRVTRENVGQYMLRECRCGDHHHSGIVAGWHVQDDCCLVSCVVNDGEESIIQFSCVEVLDAFPT